MALGRYESERWPGGAALLVWMSAAASIWGLIAFILHVL